jgi:DNA-binding transcriptional LysR family regulator
MRRIHRGGHEFPQTSQIRHLCKSREFRPPAAAKARRAVRLSAGKTRLAVAPSARFTHLPQQQARSDLESGRLVRLLSDWRPPFSGRHLYRPSRRQPTQAFAPIVDALRFGGGSKSGHEPRRIVSIRGPAPVRG